MSKWEPGRLSPAPGGNLTEEIKGGRTALRREAWGQTWISNNKHDWDDEGGVGWLTPSMRGICEA